jgi:hypothetical protein
MYKRQSYSRALLIKINATKVYGGSRSVVPPFIISALHGRRHYLAAPEPLYHLLLQSVYPHLSATEKVALLKATFSPTPIVSFKASVPTLALHISETFLKYFTSLH